MPSDRNLKYQVSNTASILGLKDAHNAFIDNMSVVNYVNIAKNSQFNRYNATGVLYDWTVNSNYTGAWVPTRNWYQASFTNQGFIKQYINSTGNEWLKPNTVYSAVLLASAGATGIVFEVTSEQNYQVYDINDITKHNSATTPIEVSGDTMVKHMVSFRTNSTEVSGNIFLSIRNTKTSTIACTLDTIALYEGLVEIACLPMIELPSQNQSWVASGSPYSTVIFNEAGVAVSAAQRAQSSDKLYNVGGVVETTVNDVAAASTSTLWTSNKVNTTINTHVNTTTAGIHGSAVANTANTIVHRGTSGEFSSGLITGDITNSRSIISSRNIADCNAEFVEGTNFYTIKYGFAYNPCANAPVGSDFGELITITDDNSSACHQEFISLYHGGNEPRRWMRAYQSLYGWSAWSEIATVAKSVPAGSITAYAGNVVPSGWLPCEGFSLPIVDYPALFSAIGYLYGGGGANFWLPNLVDKFIRGIYGNLGEVDAGSGGISYFKANIADGYWGMGTVTANLTTGAWTTHIITGDPDSGANQGVAFAVKAAVARPPSLALQYIIKY